MGTIAVVLASVAGPAIAAPPAARAAAVTDPARAALARMSLDEKIGQLFQTYVYGESATTTNPAYTAANRRLYGVDTPAQVVAKYHLGGVIYFTWTGNLGSPEQIATLSNGLQQAATSAGDPPLLVSTDQEGGNVSRLAAPFAVSPGNMAIGATFSPGNSYAMSRATGEQLKAVGINVDDAPVVDVNTNPANAADGPRSFGDRAGLVAGLSAASVRGYQEAGIAATAKHFPGLGSTTVNTDNGVAVSDQTRAQFERNDLPPFRAAIAAGVDLIMAAHIIAPALDPSGAPASVSEPIITGLLRDRLRYDGVVVTDALSAAALESVPTDERALRALRAGGDQLLMPENLAASIDAIRAAVENGQVSQARLDQSVLRILRLKHKLGLFENPLVDAGAAASRVGTGAQQATAARVASDSITLVRNRAGTLPLAEESGTRVLVAGWGAGTTQTLTGAIGGRGVTASRVYTGSNPGPAVIEAAVTAADANDVTVVTTYNAWSDAGQQALVRALLGTGRPVVVVALGGPYDLAYLPDAPTFVAAYGYQPATLTALVATLFGAQPRGRLPVTIYSTGSPSTVLARFGTGLRYWPRWAPAEAAGQARQR